MKELKIERVPTTPFDGQKPGTSGLRKKVKIFQSPGYTENFVQATLTGALGDKVKGSTLVVGGDGRYFLRDSIQIIARIAAANGVIKCTHISLAKLRVFRSLSNVI